MPGPAEAPRRAFWQEWLLQNGILVAVILFGVWVIMGLYRLNASVREIGSFVLNAPGELRTSAEALKRDIREAERVAGELRRKTEALGAELQSSVLKDRLATAQEAAFRMAEQLSKALEAAERTAALLPTAEARMSQALATSADAQATAAAGSARARRVAESVARFDATSEPALIALERDLADLRRRVAGLQTSVETLASASDSARRDLTRVPPVAASTPRR